jgi:hypothetical protein
MDPERGDTALANTGRRASGLFDLLRADVAARLNDDVLDPAADEQLAICQIPEIARIHPAVVHHHAGCLGVAEIAARDRRASKLHVPFTPLSERLSSGIDDANLMLGQRQAARYESQRMWVRGVGGTHLPPLFERLANERVDARWPIDR